MSRTRRSAAAAVASVVLAGAVLTGWAHASGSGDDQVHACVNSTNGQLRVVAAGQECRTSEAPLSWNRRGNDGAPGTNGASAYETWLQAGHTGTPEDFLAWLQGADGQDGEDGQDGAPGRDGRSAYEVWLDNGGTGTVEDYLASLTGPAGERGPAGPTGPAGPAGSVPTIESLAGAGCTLADGSAGTVRVDVAAGTGAVGLTCVSTTTHTLTVAKAGTGQGTVTGGPISCGDTCTAEVPATQVVTLTASAAAPRHRFERWEGACTGRTTTCSVTMDAAKQVTAVFTEMTDLTLTVSRAADCPWTGCAPRRVELLLLDGPDVGRRVLCESTQPSPLPCRQAVPSGTTVEGRVLSDGFAHWEGVCPGSGSGVCRFVVASDGSTRPGAVFQS